MKKLILILLLAPLLSFGQNSGILQRTLRAQVSGDTVILYQDTVNRNCCAIYDMEVWREADTLYWLQKDVGGICYCMCHYNLSVTIDSLEAGHYTAKVYWSWPPPELDTVYAGSIAFDITEQGSNMGYDVIDEFQSDCFPVGVAEMETSIDFVVYPNPCKNMVSLKIPRTEGIKNLYVINSLGQEIISKEITDPETDMDVSKLPRGLYLIRFINGKTVWFDRIIKE